MEIMMGRGEENQRGLTPLIYPAAKQLTDLAEFGALVSFLHNAKPIFGIESASLGLFGDLSGVHFGTVFVC
jgi:hypothetical protein